MQVVNIRGETPAYVAARNGQLPALEIIVEQGGDFWTPHATTLNTCIHAAASGGHAHLIKFLAQLACKTKRSIGLDDLNASAQTPAYLAAENGHSNALKMLFDLGASVSGYFQDGMMLRSSVESVQAVLDEYRLPRQIAVFRSIEKEDLKLLRSVWMSKFDHYFRNHIGDTPIMVAAQTGNLRLLDFLLQNAEQENKNVKLLTESKGPLENNHPRRNTTDRIFSPISHAFPRNQPET